MDDILNDGVADHVSFENQPINQQNELGNNDDDDVKVKKRKTFVKLDSAKLVDDENGISSLYNELKYNLQLKHDGHEVTDLQRMMNVYRSWQLKLIPAYKFDYFVPKLSGWVREPRVQDSLRNLRNLHKGIVTANKEQEKEDFKQDSEPEMPPEMDQDDYQIENFNEYLEAENAMKEQEAESKPIFVI